MRDIHRIAAGLVIVAMIATGCANTGLLSEEHSPEEYQIPRQLSGDRIDENLPFIVYGDNRPGWRGIERFWSKKAWATWWQLAVPFYQVFLLGNGAVGGINKLRENPDYGHKDAERVRNAIYQKAVQKGAGFIINTGDIATDGRRPKHWMHFVKQNRDDVPLVTDFPLLPVAGNHERGSDAVHGRPNYEAVFDYPAFYTFGTPYVDVFVVDSNVIIDQYQHIDDAEQNRLFEKWFVSSDKDKPSWLEQGLAKSDKPFKVVAMHHPPVGFSKHYANWSEAENGPDLEGKRRALIDMFQRHGVDILFCGHQHMYERNVIGEGADAIHVVVTGGGGAPLHAATSDEEVAALVGGYAQAGLSVRHEVQAVFHNYCLVEASPTTLTIKAFGVARDPLVDGRLLDKLVIKK